MDQIQSRIITIFRVDLGLYSLRILMKIIQRAQPLFKSDSMKNLMQQTLCVDGINVNFDLACKDILQDRSHHYELVYHAANQLQKVFVQYTDADKKISCKTGLIYNVRLHERSGIIRFSAARWLMEALVDFSCGYNMYNLECAMQLKSPSAIRMYMLTCSSTQTINYSVDFLKGMLGVDGKYKQTADFIKRCIDPAQKELEEKGFNGFTYTKICKGRKVTALAITPVRRQERTLNSLAAQAGLSFFCHPALRQYLAQECDISSKELGAHKVEINEFCKIPAWSDIIMHIVQNQKKKLAGKGYIFAAIRKEVEKFRNTTLADLR